MTRRAARARSCRRCDGTGKLTCNKCRGFGYLKKGPDDNVKAFKAGGPDSDVSNIYLCPFCKGQDTLNCFDCRGAAKHWPAQLNVQARSARSAPARVLRRSLSRLRSRATPIHTRSGSSSGGTSTRTRSSGSGGRR